MKMHHIICCCTKCDWATIATWWDIDIKEDGTFYPIIVCPKCYGKIRLVKT